MRCRRSAHLLGVLLLLFVGSVATADPLSMTVSPAGEITLRLDDRTVASGGWRLRPDVYVPSTDPTAIAVGAAVSTTAVQDGPGRFTVRERRASATADYTLAWDGKDLNVTAHVVNTDGAHPLKAIAFNGPTFHFNPAVPPTGEMNCWHWTYLQAQGLNLFHPSVASPVGCWWAGDDRFACSTFSASEFDRPLLITAEYGGRDGVIPADCQLDLFTDRAVPLGGSVDLGWSTRVSTDRSIPHLLAPYKALYDRRFPLPMYTPDDRPIAMFSEIDAQHITRNNPLGFHGPWCRFDTAMGTATYVQRFADTEHRAGLAGCIFWSPGGFYLPMYPPDFDVMPPAVAANLPALVKGFHDRGLRVGLCARAGDGVTRQPGSPPTVYRLSANDPEQMRVLADRFRHAVAMGFDMFYLDSIGGGGTNDVRIIRHLRDVVGPGVLLYSEYCTDMELPYAGRYCEWVKPGNVFWTSENARAELRLLCPRATWLCQSHTPELVPKAFGPAGLTPLVPDQALWQLPLPPMP